MRQMQLGFRGVDWKASALAAACAVLAIYAFGLLYEGFIADRYAGVFTHPFIDEPAAVRAYQRLPVNAPIAERAISATRLVQADPTNPNSWAAVCYADWLADGGPSPRVVQALERSYQVSFFDRHAALWRVGFALENWPALSPDLRQRVLVEARTALNDPLLGPKLRERLAGVRNPEGRLAALLILSAPTIQPAWLSTNP